MAKNITADVEELEAELIELRGELERTRYSLDAVQIECGLLRDQLHMMRLERDRAVEKSIGLEAVLENASAVMVKGLHKHTDRLRQFDQQAPQQQAVEHEPRRPAFLDRAIDRLDEPLRTSPPANVYS